MTLADWWMLPAGVLLALFEWRRADRANRSARFIGILAVSLALATLTRPAVTPEGPSGAVTAGPQAFLALSAPTEVALGEPLEVRGRLELSPDDSAWVVLEDPAGPRDSLRVGGPEAWFRLEDRPRAGGEVEYLLRVARGGSTLARESLGVGVRNRTPPRVLILDGSPSFESAYLKRWLAERGGRVTVRTTLTRGRFRVEHLNGTSGDPARLTASVLNGYDALLADAGALQTLSTVERAVLRAAIERDGLGLLITADAPTIVAGDPFLGGMRTRPLPEASLRSARVHWVGAPRPSQTLIEVDGVALSLTPGGDALAQDESGRTLAARRPAGAGRVALTLVRTPSRWLLDGDAQRYGAYWNRLLLAVARDTVTRVAIRGDPRPVVDRAVEVEILTLGPRPTVAITAPDGATDTLALARDPFDPRRFRGRYWPREAGWHAVLLGAREVPFRVSAVGPADEPSAEVPARGTDGWRWRRPLAFLALLLALTGLWAESRGSSRKEWMR